MNGQKFGLVNKESILIAKHVLSTDLHDKQVEIQLDHITLLKKVACSSN